jgi:outer membrane protein X
MVNNRKHWIKCAAVCLLAFAGVAHSYAQERGDYALDFSYAACFDSEDDSRSLSGISARYRYYLFDLIRVQPSMSYFFRKDYLGLIDISMDVHAMLYLSERVALYPVAGSGVMLDELPEVEEISPPLTTTFFLNFGGGMDLQLGSNVIGNIELKVKNARGESWFNASIGIGYLF